MPEARKEALPEKPWAAGQPNRKERAIINSLYIDPNDCEKHNEKLAAKYKAMEEAEVRYEYIDVENADVLLAAYGTMARVCTRAAKEAREKLNLKVGIVRPITVWPFPYKALHDAAAQKSVKAVVSIEMSCGQMVDDVRIAVAGEKPVSFYGRAGGVVPTVKDILSYLSSIKEGK